VLAEAVQLSCRNATAPAAAAVKDSPLITAAKQAADATR